MGALTHSLIYELPKELHFDKYAQHILENSRTPNLADTTTISLASSPSISNLDSAIASTHQTTTSEFFKKLGNTFIHSISLPRTNTFDNSFPGVARSISSVSSSAVNNIDMEFNPDHFVIDSHNYNDAAMNELQKQLEYDKFMNEVWIGVVLTLILISMIFCFCSCFLYHQFRTWKRDYRTTVIQTTDAEAVKLNMELEDPVPEYTLVSGLPSYEAALELMHKNPRSCLIVPPSVFQLFNENEKSSDEESAKTEEAATIEVSLPLLFNDGHNTNTNKSCGATVTIAPTTPALTHNHSLASLLSLAAQKPSQFKGKSAG